MSNFHPLEVVGHAGETQLEMGAKLNIITLRVKVKVHLYVFPQQVKSYF